LPGRVDGGAKKIAKTVFFLIFWNGKRSCFFSCFGMGKKKERRCGKHSIRKGKKRVPE
jgi:hypothetical protein